MLKRASKLMAGTMAMAMIVTACGSGDTKGTDSGTGTKTTTGDNQTAPTAETKKVNVKMMANFSSSNLSETDKLLIESFEKATNTQIQFDIPPSTGYNERLQLSLTTGDYPDVVFFSSPSLAAFQKAVKDGVVIPIDDYLKTAENIKKHSYDISWDALRVNDDNKIYGIPRTSVIRSDGYWLRKDWLDKLNIKLPANSEITLEEMNNILSKFTKEDPDGNGRADTYGYAAYAGADKTLTPIFTNELGLYGWQDSTGGDYKYTNPQYDLNDDKYTKALELTSKLFKEGLIDPDAPTLNATTAQQRFESGKTGVLSGFAGNYELILNNGKKVNPNFDLAYVFVRNEKGEMKGLGQGTGLYGFWAVTKNAKDPQRVVDLFDYMLSDKGWDQIYNGVEGKDYKVENNTRVFTRPTLETFARKSIVRRANDYMFFIAPDMSEDLKKILIPHIEKSVKRMVLSKNRDYVPPIATTPEYLDFNKKISEVTTKIIVGDKPSSEYKKVLTEWNTKFGKTYMTEMNAYITKMEAKK
ncbi:MAG: hypothetical protein K0Q73_3443 [Paenibacillus sp.]|nr:hypothetical protein [Paenibacillus sp.]